MRAMTLLRAVAHRGRLPPDALGPIERAVALSPIDLPAYAAWLGVPADPPPLPALYPWAQAAHLRLLIDPSVGVPVLGMVHANNWIARVAPIPERPEVTLRVVEVDPIAGRRALQLDTLWHGPHGVAAAMRSTYLFRGKTADPQRPPTAEDPPLPERAAARSWAASAGRAYAQVSGDYNPIHLAAPLARMLGQKGAIAHGMAIAAAAWADDGARAPYQEVSFRRPVVLPATTTTHRDPATGAFRVVGADGTVHARGLHGDPDAARAALDLLLP
jgi:acyl dehydratase